MVNLDPLGAARGLEQEISPALVRAQARLEALAAERWQVEAELAQAQALQNELAATHAQASAAAGDCRQLKETTKDTFDSVRYLWRARATAYVAHAAESRWLLDRAQAAAAQQEFTAAADQVAQAPVGVSLGEIADHARTHLDHSLADGFQGLLAQELGNITYEGELAAAVETFGTYMDVDREIRRLENTGQHDRAVALCLSDAPGGSNAAFARFDAALDKVLGINVDYFHRFADEGRAALRVFGWLIPGFAAAALLVCAGFWPRVREYRR